MLVSPDQEVLVTNDGATIVESMQVKKLKLKFSLKFKLKKKEKIKKKT